MKSELERTKQALAVAVRVIGSAISQISTAVELIDLEGLAGCMTADLSRISQVLNPPPEMEEVEETAGWVNVYRRMGGHLYIGGMLPDQDAADQFASDAGNPKVGTQEIKVKVQRPKKQMVERRLEVQTSHNGFIWLRDGSAAPRACGLKEAVITWQEEQ